jgi:hypothetical protein
MQPDPLNLSNNLYSDQNLLFDVKFLNLEYYFNKIYIFFQNIFGHGAQTATYVNYPNYTSLKQGGIDLAGVGNFIESLLYFLLIFFITVTAYSAVRVLEIRKREHHHLEEEIAEYAHRQKEKEKGSHASANKIKNEKWEMVLKNLFSESEANWKLAIIDADEMLFDLMQNIGFKGESLGDILKKVDRDDFKGLSAAWEVHIIRNRIAHEGSEFILTQREAKRVIALYEQIFRDYGFI